MIACAETAQAGIEWVRMCMRARAPCAAHHARVSCICQGEGERACTCALQTYVPVPMLEIAKQYPPSSSRIFRFQLLEDSALAPTTHSEEVVCGCLSSWRACVSACWWACVRAYVRSEEARASISWDSTCFAGRASKTSAAPALPLLATEDAGEHQLIPLYA